MPSRTAQLATGASRSDNVNDFFKALEVQRWDDHRYYHHSRINQSLHLVSAISFVIAYVLLFVDPVAAALTGWLVSMTSRQAGHFFFEPKGYDHVNMATHEHKEEIKVGYNLRRKVVLMALWAAVPLLLWLAADAVRTGDGAVGPRRLRAPGRRGLAAARRRRAAVPHLAPVPHRRRPHRPGLDDQDPDRPVPRHPALPPCTALPAAR